MRYSKVRLDSIGYALAPEVVSSEELEERLAPVYRKLRFAEGQLAALTGIGERRWWPENYRVSDGAIQAARKALDSSHVPVEALGTIIYTGVNRENFEPATACRVAAELGVRGDAGVYDISNACLGMLNGMLDIANQIELGQIRAGLVVSCETAREINDIMIDRMIADPSMEMFTRSLATLTGGSGAAAIVLSDGSFDNDSDHRLLGGVTYAAPEHHALCEWGLAPEAGDDALVKPIMVTDAVSVLKHGVALGEMTWNGFLEEMDWRSEDIDKVVCHQVGQANRDTILKIINVPEDKDFSSFEFLGNMGTVSLPMTAALADERGFLDKGEKVAFLGIGSGLNCMMLGLEW